jgi:hypothetical protein
MIKKKFNKKSIMLKNLSADPYLFPNKPVLLNSDGSISCGDIIVRDKTNNKYLIRYYEQISKYLIQNKYKYDLTIFKKTEIQYFITDLLVRNKKFISTKKLIDIFYYQNTICYMRDASIGRIANYAYRKWWKQYKYYLRNDFNKAIVMRKEMLEKSRIADNIRNNSATLY